MSDSFLPPLPQIQGADIDLMLDVYTHHTLRVPGQQMKEGYGDTQRLRDLGQKTLELVVTYVLFSQDPMKSAEEIQVSTIYIFIVAPDSKVSSKPCQAERNTHLSPENIELWVNSYGLKAKLRIAPTEALTVLNDPRVSLKPP